MIHHLMVNTNGGFLRNWEQSHSTLMSWDEWWPYSESRNRADTEFNNRMSSWSGWSANTSRPLGEPVGMPQ